MMIFSAKVSNMLFKKCHCNIQNFGNATLKTYLLIFFFFQEIEIPVCEESTLAQYLDDSCTEELRYSAIKSDNIMSQVRKCECLTPPLVESMHLDAECRSWAWDENTLGGQAEICLISNSYQFLFVIAIIFFIFYDFTLSN